MTKSKVIPNCTSIPISDIADLSPSEFAKSMEKEIKEGGELCALFARPETGRTLRLYSVVSKPQEAGLIVNCCAVAEGWSSLARRCPQAHLFEREIAENWGLKPSDHPKLKPVRFASPHEGRQNVWSTWRGGLLPAVTNFFRVEGKEVHEVAVGPIHAGVIEPGHFRFQCHGETVFCLEIALGYQHRGLEKKLAGAPDKRTLHYMETLAGDTTIGHALAYSELCEGLAGAAADDHAAAVRVIALELERLANHTGDLGALAGDVAYLPTQSYCGRLRGDFLNMTALICGNRFGRGLVRPGGVGFELNESAARQLLERLEIVAGDLKNAVDLLWATPSVMARFEEIGGVTKEAALALGLTGPCARACGIRRDVRADFPTGAFVKNKIACATHEDGNVYARALVRWVEIKNSIKFIRRLISEMPSRSGPVPLPQLPADRFCAALVEGWRGRICHCALTDGKGAFAAYKIIDPSFFNWSGLEMALREQQISDFPICNKSFNLSYCGHDL